MGLLRDIVNKTNIAEAKAGVNLADVDMEKAAEDEESQGLVKKEGGDEDDGGISQLADLLTAKNRQQLLESRKAAAPKSDAIQGILTSAGVNYTHDNSEVIGSSKVEEHLSRQAVLTSYADGGMMGQTTLFAGSQEGEGTPETLHGTYNPPQDVQQRQFCEMAREFGFTTARDFALVVESWTQEQRRQCLDTFYRRREAKVEAERIAAEGASAEEEGVKLADPADAEGDPDTKFKVETDMKPDITAETSPEVKEEVKKETKDEVQDGVKEEIAAEVKAEVKAEKTAGVSIKGESDPAWTFEPLIKTETTPIKKETDNKEGSIIKVEGGKKRVSIFLSDDDDDDEL
jgi:hypothetical protein